MRGLAAFAQLRTYTFHIYKAEVTEPVDSIYLRIRRSCDWTYAVICTIGFFLFSWAAVWARDLTPQDLIGIRFEKLVAALLQLIGPTGFRTVTGLMAAVTGAIAIGAIWRLRDPRFSLTATNSGLVFHPSICSRPLAWSDVEKITITSGKPKKFSIKLRYRYLSLYMPLSSRTVEIPLMVSGWKYRQAQKNISQMKRWSREELLAQSVPSKVR